MTLYLVTGNKNKFEEAKAILPILEQYEIDLTEIQEIDARKIIEHKLEEARKHKNGAFIVEDTSLYLNCLNGLPGPLIKWFLKVIGNEGLYRICKDNGDFRAKAINLLGYYDGEKTHFFEGKVLGDIVAPKSAKGFGWDPIFMPRGYDKTFYEMTSDEKNAISHRRKAINKLKKFLKEKDEI